MNEIVSYGQKYSLTPGVKVFVKSAKRYCDKLTVIGLDLPGDISKFFADEGVNVFDGNLLVKKYNVDKRLSPYTLKVIFFYLYTKHVSTADKVFMCDLADVLVQQNVFDLVANDKPYVSSENNTIENCTTNSTWINLCYNQDIFNIVRNKDILNGGMYLGKRLPVTDLLKELCLELSLILGRIGNYPTPDQAALCKLVHFDFYRYNIVDDFSLMNLAHYSHVQPELENELYSFNGKTPHVIHQYKVNKPFETSIYKAYD